METQSSSAPITTKKLRHKVKIAFYMLRKTLAKTKLLIDLHLNLRDGKLARNALTSLLLHHHYAATTCGCASNNMDKLFISPQKHKLQSSGVSKCKFHDDDKIKQVVLDMLNDGGSPIEPSLLLFPAPLVVSPELRVNETPLREDAECQVDKAAEEFIKKFYKQLKQQNITYADSPSPNHLWAQ
ncbi:hypothetical protein HanIR_Chr01g0025951 [Helianthus annuus]|nr:hypothetical protein HanIR_Chr01g0025951 [Helianthus annuus]